MKLFALILSFLFFLNYSSVNAQDEIILFYSDTCNYCKEVFTAIEEENLDEKLEIHMANSDEDGFRDLFTRSLEECGLNPDRGGYPTLYHNGDCSVGSTNIIATLYELGEIDVEIDEDENDDERVTFAEENNDNEVEIREPEPRPFSHYIVMIVGPAILLALGYFMIRKLNL